MNRKAWVALFLFCISSAVVAREPSLVYEQQCARNPHDYAALYNAGVAAFKENKLERAQECFDALKKIGAAALDERQGEELFYNAGNTEIKLQKYAEAIESFKKVLTYNPHNEKAQQKLAHAQQMLQQKKQQEQEQQQSDEKNDQQERDNNEQRNDRQQERESESEQQKRDEQHEHEEQKNNEQKADNRKPTEREQKQDQHKEQESKGAEKSGGTQNQEERRAPEPELTKDEQQLLAAVEDLDKRMQGALDARKLKKAEGSTRGYHNW
ncbi:MAG: tetratricopeptide repeat protein [Candidatus Kerfeldbacteria bacterium]|nr:tetratricopeptide repeat protein [Candidatus Kerfeldbacteria bacterium]